jgi:hypothetical protein
MTDPTPDPVATQRQRLAELIDRRREVKAILDADADVRKALENNEWRLRLSDECLAVARDNALDGHTKAAKLKLEQFDAQARIISETLQEMGAWELEPA